MTAEGRGARVAVDASADAFSLFQAVLESMGEAVFVVRPSDRVILMTNPAAGRLFGVDPGSLVGQSTRVLYDSEVDYASFGEESEHVLDTNGPYRGEHRFRRAGGEIFEAEVAITPIDPDAWDEGVVSIVRDVSDAHRAEEVRTELLDALNERIKELRGLHETALLLADRESELRDVLQRVVDILPEAWQYPEHTVARVRYRDVVVGSAGFCETEWAQRAEFTGLGGHVGEVAVGYLVELPEADDGPFLDEERELIRSLAFLVGSHVRTREQWEQAEQERDRFITLFRTGPVAMALSHPEDGRFVEVNDHWVELAGYEREELIGRTAMELGLWDEQEDRDALRAEIEEKGAVRGVELHYRRRGVDPRVALGSVQRIEFDGRPLWFTTLIDRTREVAIETERAQLADQKQALVRLGAIGELAGGIAHDFNNLLLPILINVELGLADASGEDRVRLEEIREAAVRGRDLTRKLLAFGRRTDPHKRRVRLDELVRSAEPILRRLIPESISLDLAPADPTPPIVADPTLVEQVLLNLVVNASDAIEARGKITIGTEARRVSESDAAGMERTGPDFDRVEPGDYVYLEVADDGRGIPPDVMDHIFEPFFTTKDESVGTGLGLASVLGIVKQHAGHIVLETEAGAGTRFRVGFPAGAEGGEAEELPERSPVRGRVGEGYRIMVVEDDDSVRRVTVRALRVFGFEVTEAASPDEALAVLDEAGAPFHAVLSDMVMPGMTGLELSDAIRERAPEMPVLFASGYSADVLAKHGVDRESIRVLQKPFAPEALVQAMMETLREAGDA